MASSVVTVAEVKRHLSITDSQYDADLDQMVDAAVALVENRCGPLDAKTVVRSMTGNVAVLPLPDTGDITVSSIVDDRTVESFDLTDVTVDAATGVLRSPSAYLPNRFTITYSVAAVSPVPDALIAATKVIVQHMWKTRQGSGQSRPGSASAEGYNVTGAGFTIPYRAEALMAPYAQHLGFG